MFLVARQGAINDPLKLFNETENLYYANGSRWAPWRLSCVNKYVKRLILANSSGLEAKRRRSNQRYQVFTNQPTRRLRINVDLYFKSGKDACMSSKLWDIEQCVLQRFIREICDGIPQKEGHFKMAKN
jgi:hypothetical protein